MSFETKDKIIAAWQLWTHPHNDDPKLWDSMLYQWSNISEKQVFEHCKLRMYIEGKGSQQKDVGQIHPHYYSSFR